MRFPNISKLFGYKEQPKYIDFTSENCLKKLIKDLVIAEMEIRDFINPLSLNGSSEYVSLGQNCLSSWYLKQVGLKKFSYPFDWIFSSTEIVEDCVADNFAKFLNKKYYLKGKVTGHTIYHSHLFNHFDPLDVKYFQYYKRCCSRFEKLLTGDFKTIFFINLINEPNERVSWSKGFNRDFQMPIDQNLTTALDFSESFKSNFVVEPSFVFLNIKSNSTGKIEINKINNNFIFLDYCAIGSNTGVYFENPLDDFVFKSLFSQFTLPNLNT